VVAPPTEGYFSSSLVVIAPTARSSLCSYPCPPHRMCKEEGAQGRLGVEALRRHIGAGTGEVE